MMQAGTERPRFRQDLLAEAVDDQGAKYIDVMDPDSGNVFRFYEAEFSLAVGMDGERDVPGLVKWAHDELGLTATANEIRTVIATLGDLGYLDMSGAARAAAADVPARPELEVTESSDTVVESRPLGVPPATRTPPAAEKVPPRAAAAVGGASEVSIDLSEHLAVGKEDVQEAVRQSRVMSAVEVPELAEPAAKQPAAAAVTQVARPGAKQPVTAERPAAKPAAQAERPAAKPAAAAARPIEAKQPERPIEVKQPERPIEVKQPEPPVEVKQPERPIEVKQPEPPVEVKQPERPVERPEVQKPAVELPKVPEKQPVPPPAPARRLSPAVIVVLILVILGIGAFLVWKLVLDKPSGGEATSSMVPAPVQPQPQPPEPPPPEPPKAQWVTAKFEMSSGKPKTILAVFPGVIEWIETSGREVKSNDIIMKLRGYRPLEQQLEALTKEVEKLQADMQAAYKARDEVPAADEAALKKAQAKVDAAEKVYDTKNDLLNKKIEQLEPYYVRLVHDGTLTVQRKVGEAVPESTPLATIQPPSVPTATFKIPPDMKLEVGVATALKAGEKILTCEIADWEPEVLRVTCDPGPDVAEGVAVSWQLPT